MAKKDKKVKKNKATKNETQASKAAATEQVKAPKTDKAPKKAKKVVKLAHEKPKLSKAAIEKRIISKIEAETKTTIEIGILLEEAKHYFYEGKKLNGAAHVEWATEMFGFARAQTYKYIKIGKVFGELDGFDGVPMGVLAVMSSDDKILKAALADQKQARKDKDTDFKIDNVWLKEYNAKLEEERKLALEEKEELTLEQELELIFEDNDATRELWSELTGKDAGKKQPKTLQKDINSHIGKEDEEGNCVITKALFDIEKRKKEEQEANAKVSKAKYDKVEAELNAKAAELETMKVELEEAQANTGESGGGEEILNARDKALHAHMSKLPAHLVLGVAEGAAKRDVNKAKRALEKVYSPKFEHGCESIWTLIENAVKEMTA